VEEVERYAVEGAKKVFMYREWTDNGPTMHRHWTDNHPRKKSRKTASLKVERTSAEADSKTIYLLVVYFKNY
jgi:hypothetical protein